jgi:O-antigen ligase
MCHRSPVGVGAWNRSLLAAGTVAASMLAGWALAREPVSGAALGGLLAVGGAAVAVARPRVALAGFGVAAFASEWFFEAARQGRISLPSAATSVATWSALAWLAAAAFAWRRPGGLAALTLPAVRRATLIYASGVALEVLIAIGHGVPGSSWEGAQAVLIATVPIPLMAILATQGERWAVRFVVAAFAAEVLFGLAQRGSLEYGSSGSWLTLGDAGRWWDSRAIFGTFASSGNHAYGNILVFAAAILLPLAINAPSRRGRTVAWLLFALTAFAVVLSLSRASVLSLAVVVAVVAFGRRGGKAFAAVAVAVVLVVAVPSLSHAVADVQQRGVVDQSVQNRLTIWRALVDKPSSSWLLGDGYGQATTATFTRGVVVKHAGTSAGATTDNFYLRRIVEGGVVGLLTLLGFLFVLLRESFRRSGLWALALRALVAALAVQSVTSDTLFFDQQLAAFALVLAVVAVGLRSAGLLVPEPQAEDA